MSKSAKETVCKDVEGGVDVSKPELKEVVAESEVASAPFYQLEFNTGEQWVALQVVDPEAAQKLAHEMVAKGTYTTQIDNGIQVLPVKGARVTGPYESAAK